MVLANPAFRQQRKADFRAQMTREYEERVRQQAAARFVMAMKHSTTAERRRKTSLLAHAWVERARHSLHTEDELTAVAEAGDGGELCQRVAKGDEEGVAASLAAGSAASSEFGGYPAVVLACVVGHAAILERLLAAARGFAIVDVPLVDPALWHILLIDYWRFPEQPPLLVF